MPFFETHWAKQLFIHVDPNSPRAIQLEALRKRLKIPHKEFALVVMTSAAYFRLVVGALAAGFEEEFKIASDKQILVAVAVLCAYLDLEKTRGMVTRQGVERVIERVHPKIVDAMRSPDDLLDQIRVHSLDELASKYFDSIGTYKRVPDYMLNFYREIDGVFGYVYGDDGYDNFLERAMRDVEKKLEQRQQMEELRSSIGKLSMSDFELIVDSMMGGGTDLDTVIAEIASRRNVTEDAVRRLFSLYVHSYDKGK